MVDITTWKQLKAETEQKGVTLVAVSKKKPVSDIEELYRQGERNFGENYVQELIEKHPQLPADINWHYIGHLQTNKVKYIAGFVHMIHAVDSFKLLLEINKQAAKHDRVIDVLLQLHVAEEETKHGLDNNEVTELMEYYTTQKDNLPNVRIRGVMGMATFTDDMEQVRREFAAIKNVQTLLKDTYFITADYFNVCSMGMSGDYKIAMEEGSTMVRIGSSIFGERS
ncbi:MAG: YggS family pyridoxal phosphate-dependent enzyme [Chitinophagaceae bacterium]|nr:YggS family pyridoxal phosphate-dependent enzyme [Chitinophagaceae bacterium]MCB9046041.1 YggS family pyridoxal phosphate-dependent enzyme [Chitinophagales bacterium]